jgi:hypothetical protein
LIRYELRKVAVGFVQDKMAVLHRAKMLKGKAIFISK